MHVNYYDYMSESSTVFWRTVYLDTVFNKSFNFVSDIEVTETKQLLKAALGLTPAIPVKKS